MPVSNRSFVPIKLCCCFESKRILPVRQIISPLRAGGYFFLFMGSSEHLNNCSKNRVAPFASSPVSHLGCYPRSQICVIFYISCSRVLNLEICNVFLTKQRACKTLLRQQKASFCMQREFDCIKIENKI